MNGVVLNVSKAFRGLKDDETALFGFFFFFRSDVVLKRNRFITTPLLGLYVIFFRKVALQNLEYFRGAH